MQMSVMDLSCQPQNNDVPQAPQVCHPHFRGFAYPTSYGNHSNCTPLTRSFVPSQFNRIGSEVMQSISGQEPILGPTQTLLEDEKFSAVMITEQYYILHK